MGTLWRGGYVAFGVLSVCLTACGGGVAGDGDAPSEEDSDVVGTSQEELALRSGNLWHAQWTGLTQIPVCFTNGTAAQRSHVRSVAESSWEALGKDTLGPNGRYGVDFTGFGACPANKAGMIPVSFNTTGTNQTIGLGLAITSMTLDPPEDATIIHEFGHALGYTHEFRRSDYSSVDPDCPETQGTVPDLAVGPVDTGSIMNYYTCGSFGSMTLSDALSHMSLYGPWSLSYGQIVAIRHEATWNYVRGDADPDTLTSGILADREFRLVNANSPSSTGQISFGDSVRIKTNDGKYLKSNGRNALVTKTSTTSAATTWQIYGRITSGPVSVNDEVVFRASDFAYLRSSSSNQLTTDVSQLFQLTHLGSALNL